MKRATLIVLLLTCMQTRATESSTDRVQSAVAAALASMQAGTMLVPGSLRFPKVSFRADAAQLLVDKVTISRTGHIDARVRCAPRHACLPFAVTAELIGQKSPAVWSARHSGPRGTELRTSASQADPKHRTLKVGDRVLFVREHDGVRTGIQAITLNNAAIGDAVRVRAIDGKHEIMRGRLYPEHIVREDS